MNTGTNTIHTALANIMTEARAVSVRPSHGASAPLRYASQSRKAAEASMIVIDQAGHS